MAQYIIRHPYRAVRDGQTYGPWVAGDRVDLDAVTAEWLERDSPGILAGPEVVDDADRQQSSARDRQMRPGRNRGA